MCMTMRGVEKEGAKTTTSCMLGELRENPKSRQEFLSLVKQWNIFIIEIQFFCSCFIYNKYVVIEARID